MHLSKQHLDTVTTFFKEEKIAIPHGFTKDDVNPNAPRLFSDIFYLLFIYNQAKLGIHAYGMALANSARADIRKFYAELNASSIELFNRSVDVMLSKGVFMRAPFIPYPEKVEYVEQQGFLTGWFGDRRPLNGVEITQLYFNLMRNLVGSSLTLGLGQVAKSTEVRNFLIRGSNIAQKHVEIFQSILAEVNLPTPNIWDTVPTTSTVAPFSDKLMMFHISVLNGAGVGYYGASLGSAMRRDLGAHYSRLIAEILQFSEDGANIMIQNGWMEKPPHAPDRQAMVEGTTGKTQR